MSTTNQRRYRSRWVTLPSVWASLFILPFLALAFLGCGPSGQKSKLVGSWQLNAGLAFATTTYSKDNTWVMTVTGLVNGSASGDWKLDGNRLLKTTKTSTLEKTQVGKKETLEIVVKLDDSVLILKGTDDNGKEQLITLTRIK